MRMILVVKSGGRRAFYRILRNAPDICSFLTFDRKMRNQLEVENAALKANIEVGKAENNALKAKIEEGKAENDTLKVENEKLKQQIVQLMLNDDEGETNKRQKCNM